MGPLTLFWKKFLILSGVSIVLAPLATYLLSLAGLAFGIDVFMLLLFVFALRVLVYAVTATHLNTLGIYFIFLSIYASGAMAYGVETKQIEGWEWVLAVLDVTVVLTSTSIGTRCFYEAVSVQRAALAKRA